MNQVDIMSLRLHPDAEKVPLPDGADLRSLRDSLRENGQEDPIDVTADGVILDGRTRWTLLQDLGAISIGVRVVPIPEQDQTTYIVDRALSRRHLTADQKRALNSLLRGLVVETLKDPTTGEEMRIGLSRPARATKLGVTTNTVKNWDGETDRSGQDLPNTLPTHIRRAGGNPTPYPVAPAKPERSARVAPKPKRTSPPWLRHYTTWCRAVLPEDRKFLIQMSEELHKALGRLDLTCGSAEGDQG